jgi:hypothetical protein
MEGLPSIRERPFKLSTCLFSFTPAAIVLAPTRRGVKGASQGFSDTP